METEWKSGDWLNLVEEGELWVPIVRITEKQAYLLHTLEFPV